ncbi:MAG: signal peptidase I [Firmicutes bacterium]|nr:signal peptidase I [Bacillota bacterium]
MNKKNKGKETIRVLLLILCGFMIGLQVYMANANALVGEKLPMPFGYGAAVVLSGSMEPELSKGDLIFVKEDTFDVGDVVVYQDVNYLVVHRVISINEDTVVTKGDANNTDDGEIPMSVVKGKVTFWIPALGYFVNFMKTGVGTALTLIAAFLLIEIPRRREAKKDEQEREKIIAEIERLRKEI